MQGSEIMGETTGVFLLVGAGRCSGARGDVPGGGSRRALDMGAGARAEGEPVAGFPVGEVVFANTRRTAGTYSRIIGNFVPHKSRRAQARVDMLKQRQFRLLIHGGE